MRLLFLKLLKNKSGATAIEYGLISALVAVAMIGSVSSFGNSLNATFVALEGQINTGPGAPAAAPPAAARKPPPAK